jgi:hypothetical protein
MMQIVWLIIHFLLLCIYALALGLSVAALTALSWTLLQQHIDAYVQKNPDSFITYVLNLLFSPPFVLLIGIFSSVSVLIGLKLSSALLLITVIVVVSKSALDEYKQHTVATIMKN